MIKGNTQRYNSNKERHLACLVPDVIERFRKAVTGFKLGAVKKPGAIQGLNNFYFLYERWED